MRLVRACLGLLLLSCPLMIVQSQAPDAIAAARQAVAAAFPGWQVTDAINTQLLGNIDRTDLGCPLIRDGLPLPTGVDVYRLEFPVVESKVAVHVTADGSLAQLCDESVPNLGAGVIPVARVAADSDGDGLTDLGDSCPLIAGIAAAQHSGCPQPSASDRDGDGIADSDDRCPEQAGSAISDGCAMMRDEDGDGIPDHVDICRADYGIMRDDFALGCPADGSGSSSTVRGEDDRCRVRAEGLALYASASDADSIGTVDPANADSDMLSVLGRSADNAWYRLAGGFVSAARAQLAGACYNIPLVNPTAGKSTGCFMRPQGEFANVREAPGGAVLARLFAIHSEAVLGQNLAGDWLFYRAGWVSRAVLALSGACAQLPTLDPGRVASGSIHFCPPAYEGYLRPRFGIGEHKARVVSQTLANRLRAEPDITAEQIGDIRRAVHRCDSRWSRMQRRLRLVAGEY